MKDSRFESQLGEVAVTDHHIERWRSDSEEWERIEENFSEEKLIDEAQFMEIEDLKLEKGSIYPNIKLKIDGDWKRMFFHVGDEADECFRRLRYRWNSYQQNQ